MDDSDQDVAGGSYYLHLSLSLVAAVSFWCQSVVTEERLVPALNVLADHYRIPDDVAGATLMAAGASSPELLCTLVSLFVTHSSLGLGTIVGSEIFNQLVICAGSVYATKGEALVLDRRMVAREAGFYGLSIGLLYVSLSESREDGDGVERAYVSFWKALLLFGGYVLYVAVCANTESVEKWLRKLLVCIRYGEVATEKAGAEHERVRDNKLCNDEDQNGRIGSDYQLHTDEPGGLNHSRGSALASSTSPGSVQFKNFDGHDFHQLPFIYNVTTEPVENWDSPPLSSRSLSGGVELVISNSSLSGGGEYDANITLPATEQKKKNRGIISAALHKSFKLMKANYILCRDDCPVEINDVYELTGNDGTHEIGCFLWQRSIFYTKAYFGSHAFHLRWFTITDQRIVSVPDRQEPEKHSIVYPLFHELNVDDRRLIINIVHPTKGKRDFTLMAPSKAIFDAVVQGLERYMNETQSLRIQGIVELDDWEEAETPRQKRHIDADPHVDLIELPRNYSPVELALWISVYPLRLVMHYTLPELRHLDHHGQPQKSIMLAYISSFSCLVWLIVGSYAMVYSLEHLAALIGISDAIMGVTISAAGTSLPAYIASRIAAEKGFGNQAVANVFGSNTFNICVGLGMPWVVYTASSGFGPYHDLEKEGILESILVLAWVLLLFVLLMISTNFILVKWHANLFIFLYVVYVTRAIGQEYW